MDALAHIEVKLHPYIWPLSEVLGIYRSLFPVFLMFSHWKGREEMVPYWISVLVVGLSNTALLSSINTLSLHDCSLHLLGF
jgi:hypothetical protein